MLIKSIEDKLQLPSPLTKLESQLLSEKGVSLYMKRDDLIHKDVSGNKWRKLKYNLVEALEQSSDILLSFGGPYSNHLSALAAIGNITGIKTIGYVRGEIDESNRTIVFLREMGMELFPISRTDFRKIDETEFLKSIHDKHENAFIIPMGGTNEKALEGVYEMMEELVQSEVEYDYICTPIGSGGTAAGIINKAKVPTLVFNMFKKDFVNDLLSPLVENDNWKTVNGYHFGGFAKTNESLLEFILGFEKQFGIQLDYVYNGKMMYGLMDMIKDGYFPRGSKIIAIHTGGVQGNLYI